ncbi:citrate synthase/methylcitrate synthase [Salinirubellus salinus]|uniref:Citrate synthase n=1 Tax=Salinirubellus salinus TaxID=1364945 RepID=A0A9E7R6S5_9EURY|nr:citrate/2-methylcitrate synthase [Salinirubellus salinus]UWM55720.1 citrate synthase/methylcitrate synthase [Salinirubellus salinus]
MTDTDDEYRPGLEGVVAELATQATIEETLFLLYEDRLPTPDERESLRASLAANRTLPAEALAAVRATAEAGGDAMDALRAAVGAAHVDYEPGDPAADALRAAAVVPTAAAAYWRYHENEEPLAPNPDLRHAADYLRMLTGEAPAERAVRGIETYLNAVVDHGFNASTFTARAIVSTESDVLSGVTGAIGALKGPLHGGAPGPVLDMLEEVHESGDPEGWVHDRLDAGERLMGFGHRVYRVRDPRAAVLSTAAEAFYAEDDAGFFESATEFESVARDVLRERKPDHRLDTNVEFYTAVLHAGIGIPRELFTATFAVGRVGGWTAHALEQLENNRIVRPRARYVGAEGRRYVPDDER